MFAGLSDAWLVASVGRRGLAASRLGCNAGVAVRCQAAESIARDYIEGWYTGDAERMDRAFHEDLVKRMLVREGSPEASGNVRFRR